MPFRKVGKTLVQQGCGYAVEYPVAEEFQPLVMRGAVTAMCEGLLQELGVLKLVTEPRGKCCAGRAAHRRRSARMRYVREGEDQYDARYDYGPACGARRRRALTQDRARRISSSSRRSRDRR